MIIRRTSTDPESANGFHCVGKATSAGTGILTITVKGADFHEKISGISFAPVLNEATKVCNVQITSIAYVASTRLTTILARVFVSDDITSPAFTLTDSIVVHYSFWVNEKDVPTNEATNDTTKWEY